MPSEQYLRTWSRWQLVGKLMNRNAATPGLIAEEKALRAKLDELEREGALNDGPEDTAA